MVKEDTKQRIDAMTTDEMGYEINRGHRSRFQRDNFAYLKTSYEARLRDADVSLNPSEINANTAPNWHNRPLGQIAIGVIVVVIGAFAIYLIWRYFGIQLYGG